MIIIIMKIWKNDVRVHKSYERFNVRVHESYERSLLLFFSFLSSGQKHKARQEIRQPQSRVGRPRLGAWHDEKGQ